MDNNEAILFRTLCTKEGWAHFGPEVVRVLYPGTVLQMLYHYLEQLHDRVQRDIRPQELGYFIGSVVKDEEKAQELMNALGDVDAPVVSEEVMSEVVRQFASRQLAWKACEDIIENHTNPDFNPLAAYELLNQSVEAFQSGKPPIINYTESDLPDLSKDRPNMCPLLLSARMDESFGGGVAAGEMVVFIAGAKKGKTSILSTIGSRNARAGRRVLHVPLEVSANITQRRYDSEATGLDYDGLLNNPRLVTDARKAVLKSGGEVCLVDWQYDDRSPSDLISLARYTKPDMLIVDYLQLMIPDRTRTFSRQEQRHLYSRLGKDMRGVAKKLQIPVVTAWQTNRAGDQADTVTQHDIAECWDIVQHADIIMGISRSPQERIEGTIRMNTLMQRFGEHPGHFQFRVNFEQCQLAEIMPGLEASA